MARTRSVPLVVKGIALERESRLPILLLQCMNDTRLIPVPVGPAEASSIIMEMEGALPPRPLSHDLIAELFRRHHLTALRLEIYGQSLGKYLARLVYTKAFVHHSLEVRPSDGVALALRLAVPILADASLLGADRAEVASYDDYTPEASEILYLSSF